MSEITRYFSNTKRKVGHELSGPEKKKKKVSVRKNAPILNYLQPLQPEQTKNPINELPSTPIPSDKSSPSLPPSPKSHRDSKFTSQFLEIIPKKTKKVQLVSTSKKPGSSQLKFEKTYSTEQILTTVIPHKEFVETLLAELVEDFHDPFDLNEYASELTQVPLSFDFPSTVVS